MSLLLPETNAAHSMLAPLASWALNTLDATPPKLIGVELGDDVVSMQVIELEANDPLGDLANLAAPDSWSAIVVLAEATACRLGTPAAARHVQLAHAVDRLHHGATEYRSRSGTTASIRASLGRLDELCRGLICGPTSHR
ncbi:MAG: hypothetical protein HKN94_06265 [Acidimicrobiales bacterium]|nr:hypothetical protein [Acidimicrobiales bacterium]RZV46629.1 MAG: hypothetical protein EX269_06805 [Acidimicrobiales bacterium]